jgi:uncharacterized tellurite resistance protein B-like protein
MSHTFSGFTAEDLQDMARYMQMLLQLMIVDGHLHPAEQARFKDYATRQGYSERFIDETMASALTNRHMERSPHRFHCRETARQFLKDAVQLARCDGILHDEEKAWLEEAAAINGISARDIFLVPADSKQD